MSPDFFASLRSRLRPTLACFGLSAVCLILAPAASLAQNTISTYAGGGTFGTTATTVDLPSPTGVIRDSSLNTYIAAPYSTYVFKVTGSAVGTFAGLGYENYSGDGGLATKAGLDLPTALAIDTKGNIYIADPGGSRVRKVSATNGKIVTVVGSGLKCEPSTGNCGDGKGATASTAALNLPNAIAVDAAGNIYIADSADHRIRAVNAGTKAITIAGVTIQPGDIQTIAGNGNICANPTTACGDGGVATSALLNFPEGIAVDSTGNIYIADTRDHRIREIASGSSTITAFAGSGIPCVSSKSSCGNGGTLLAAQFHFPMGLSIDPSNNLYVADSQDQEVRFINVSAPAISTVAGNGTEGFSGDAGLATAAQLNLPGSVFLDGAGNLLIADSGNQRVRVVSSGNISTLAGGGTGGDGGAATSATFANPYTVAEDAAGNLYIADTANNRIRMVNAKTQIVSTVAGTGIAGYTGDNGPATSATLNAPAAVAVDASGNVWIADTGNVVIREVTASTSVITTVAGNGESCVAYPTPACGDGGPATSGSFAMPLAIALNAAGDLFVSDYTAMRIREVTPGNPPTITTVAGEGQVGLGKVPVVATSYKFNHPLGIATDALGNVYVDDTQNNVVHSFTVGGNMVAYALSGAAHLQGDGGAKLLGGMWGPLQLGSDPSGNIYIGGGNDNVVQRVDSISGTIGTVAGNLPNGIGGFSGDGGPATSAKLSNMGLLVDGQSNLYIADAGNNRIRLVHLTPAATATPPSLVFPPTPLHQNSATQTVTFKSTGGVDLDLSSITFTGKDPSDFSETDNCVSLQYLGVDVTCTVTVTFTPLSYALRTATLSFNDNGPGGSQTVALSGNGPYFTPSMSPTSITVSPGSGGSSTLTVTPFGDFSGVINLSCTGAPTGSTCSVSPTSVTLNGTDTPQTATVTVTTTASVAPGTYTLTVKAAFVEGGGQLAYTTTLQLTIP